MAQLNTLLVLYRPKKKESYQLTSRSWLSWEQMTRNTDKNVILNIGLQEQISPSVYVIKLWIGMSPELGLMVPLDFKTLKAF